MALVKVEDHTHLRKDTLNGAVINTDRTGLEKYKKRKDRFKKIEKTEERLDRIEHEISELKNILIEVINK